MKLKTVIFRIAHIDAMSEPMPANKVQNFIESIEKNWRDYCRYYRHGTRL